MNLLIINQPLNNRGDESAHKALIRSLKNKYPNCNILVLFIGENNDSVNQFDAKLPNVKYINLHRFKAFNRFAIWGLKYNCELLWKIHPTICKIINLYKKIDYVICAPGGICMGGFQNWMHVFMLKLAKLTNKPLIYYGRSFGPFPTNTKSNRIFKRLSLEMLNYISFLSIRDKKTEDLAKTLDLKYVSTVDTAFLDSPRIDLPSEISSQISNNDYMVFVPNSLIWHYQYKNKLSIKTVLDFYKGIVSEIIKKYPQINIVMLPQTFNYGSYLGDDINFFKDLKKEIHDSRIIILDDKYSSDIQQSIISKAKFVIGARYHSIVFAINNNVPFIALSYEHKIAGLLISLNKTDRMVDITGLSDSNSLYIIGFIKECLSKLEKDEKAQLKAKSIALTCFNKLSETISN